jgi:hypothetical protein
MPSDTRDVLPVAHLPKFFNPRSDETPLQNQTNRVVALFDTDLEHVSPFGVSSCSQYGNAPPIFYNLSAMLMPRGTKALILLKYMKIIALDCSRRGGY